MIIDCHFHHDPELFTLDKLIEGMNRAGIDKTVLMAKLCGPIHEPAEIVTKLMRYSLNRTWMRPLIKKAITQFTVDGDVKLPTGIIEILRKPDNTPVFDALSAYPDRFLGWCMVNPEGPENPCDDYARWMDHPGCVGVKAHPFWHRYPLSRLLPVSEMIARKKAILILHLGFDDHGDIQTLTDAFPDLKIILAHAAFPCYGDTWRKFVISGMFVSIFQPHPTLTGK
jgi:predicted TIM-barrel fold metal-dependent hydrolase